MLLSDCISVTYSYSYMMVGLYRHIMMHRCEQGLNLRGETPLDFESNALTTRPSQLQTAQTATEITSSWFIDLMSVAGVGAVSTEILTTNILTPLTLLPLRFFLSFLQFIPPNEIHSCVHVSSSNQRLIQRLALFCYYVCSFGNGGVGVEGVDLDAVGVSFSAAQYVYGHSWTRISHLGRTHTQHVWPPKSSLFD